MMWHAATEKSFLVYLIRSVVVLLLRGGGIAVDNTSDFDFEQINRWPLLSRATDEEQLQRQQRSSS